MAPIITGDINATDEGTFSRRGASARPGVRTTVMPPQTGSNFLDDLLGRVGLGGMFSGGTGRGATITGDYAPGDVSGANVTSDAGRGRQGNAPVTLGGAGRGSGTGRVTQGGAVPLGRAPQVLQNIPVMQGGLFPRTALLGGALIPGLSEAASEISEGRPAGAAGSLVGSTTGAFTAQKIAQATLGGMAKAPGVVGLVGKVGMAAAPVLGGMFGAGVGADVAEYGKRALTGDPITGKTDLKNTLATQKQILDFMRTADQDSMNTQIAGIQQLQRSQLDMEVEAAKRLDPFIQKQLDQALVRQQALMNTQGQVYSKLGVVATAGKLATGAQAERGATTRTLLSQNPYANAIISAPSISFG